jgi:6-phosphogluconolactonase
LLNLDTRSGEVMPLGLVAELESPTFLAVAPARGLLLAVSERAVGPGEAAAYAIEPGSGKLRPINRTSTGGNGPCHICLDGHAGHALVANYGGGSVCVLPIDARGGLGQATAFVQHHGSGVDRQRQAGPHAHGVALDPTGRLALVADLGLDQVLLYDFNPEQGTLAAHDPPFGATDPGSGPRHVAFAPGGKLLYVVGEMGNSVSCFAYDAQAGRLKQVQTMPTLPADFRGGSTAAELMVHPTGRFLLVSNRGHDSIAVYRIDPQTGLLSPPRWHACGGKTPRHFTADPTGVWLLVANQDSDNVVVFRFDPESGSLTPTGRAVPVAAPTCVICYP